MISCTVINSSSNGRRTAMIMVTSVAISFMLLISLNVGESLPSSCCRKQKRSVDVIYDCSHCNLTAFPRDIPKHITVLDLSDNNIKTIDQPLISLTKLRLLNLRRNRLIHINKTVFAGLNTLTELELSNNAFQNTNGFPSEAISELHNLFSLAVDIYSDFRFDNNFLQLRNLTNIELNPISKNFNLRNITFKGLKNSKIKELWINFKVKTLEMGVFSFFPNLKGLTVINTVLFVSDLLKSLYGLQNRKMDYIEFAWNTKLFKGVVLDKDSGIYLRNICVKYLNLHRNQIEEMKTEFIYSINQCIEILDISNNLLGRSIGPMSVWVSQSKRIKYIDMSWIRRYDIDTNVEDEENVKTVTYGRTRLHSFLELNHSTVFHIHLPKSLQFLNFSQMYIKGPLQNFTVIAEGLNVVDMSFNGGLCGYFRIEGLKNVTTLNISGIDCSHPNKKMLRDMTNLTYFVAQKCQLSSDKIGPNFFQGLKNLKYIDLSDNKLLYIDSNLLKSQIDTLQILILRNNNLTKTPTESIKHLQSLKQLDLRNNQILIISDNERNIFDNMQTINRAFSVLIDNNPLLCSCDDEAVRFMHWLRTSFIVANKENLKCRLSNGEPRQMGDVLSALDFFQFHCYLKFMIMAAAVFIFIFICVVFVVRSSYKLKYWYIMKQIRLRREWQLDEFNYEYDVYVSYYEDCVWTKEILLNKLQNINDLKIFTGPRPGTSVPHEIVRALELSKKIILVLTNDYLEDAWGLFALNMALVHASHTGRIEMLTVIFQEEIEPRNMPNDLLQVLWRIKNLKWPDRNVNCDEQRLVNQRRQFWIRLSQYINVELPE